MCSKNSILFWKFRILLHLIDKSTFFKCSKFFLQKENSGQKVVFSPCEYVFMNLNEQSIDIYLIWFLCWIYKQNWNRGSRLQAICLKFIFEQKNLKLFSFVQLLLCMGEDEDDIWGRFHQLSKSSFCNCRS